MLRTNLIDARSLGGILGSCVVLDCRFDLNAPAAGRQAYLTAHVPGARYVDLNQHLAGPVTPHTGRHPLPSPEALGRLFASLGITDGVQVVVYDDANGAFAARAWWLLRWLGHAEVAVLDGGFKAWLGAGGAVESGAAAPDALQSAAAAPSAAAALVAATADLHAVATAADVQQALGDPEHRVVDARAAERYAGLVEPIDPVAGHVPGAINHPFAGNLDAGGRFLPAAELRRRWLTRLAGAEPANTIMMCGSGVTACHNLLAMELAGLTGARLYAGSWSEWIRNADRPVARGPTP
jgi:thiosulfate/3-mercaptopyruvate sulfurtransferase